LEGGSTGIPKRNEGFSQGGGLQGVWDERGEAARRLRERVPCPDDFEKHGKYGNPDLDPEWADSYEAGIDYRTRGGTATVSGTYFYQDKHDQISYQGLNKTTNVDAFSRGVEGFATWWFHPSVGTVLSYTYTDSWDKHNQREIIGVPAQRGSVSLVAAPFRGLKVN